MTCFWDLPKSNKGSGQRRWTCYAGSVSTSVVVGVNDLATTFPHLVERWYHENVKTPEQVSSGSDYRAKWLCPDCGQVTEERVYRRARENRGCPVCAGRVTVAGVNDLATLRPDIAAQFVRDPLDKHDPTTVPAGSTKRFEWRCDACGHIWEQRVSHRAAGRGCPACSGKVVVPGINDLATKFPDIAAELNDENYTADQLLPNSNTNVQWTCSEGHTWKTRVFNRTRNDSGCNTCVRKEFSSVFERDILALVRGVLPKTDIIPTARSVVKNRELDIYIPGLRLAIEANGVYWHTEQFGKTEHYHADKAENCVAQGINLITIWEDDWKSRRPAAEAYVTAQLNGHVPDTLHVKNILLDDANAFVENTTLDTPVPENGSKTQPILALGAYEGETLVAALIYRKTTEKALRIERYAASSRSSAYLDAFLQYAEGNITGYDHVLYYDNAERSYRPSFEELGFDVRNRIKPSYRLVKNSSRLPEDTADTDGLQKAWDCGGTVFKRERQAGPKDSVAVIFPELVAEWRSTALSPEMTLIGSGKKVEWECGHGHTWTCPVYHRTKRGRTCPFCKASTVAEE